MSISGYLLLLAALCAERIVELFISVRNRRLVLRNGGIESGKGHYPAMVAFHTLFMISCAAEAVVYKRPFPGLVGWVALAGALAAQGLRYWAVITLGRFWNTRIIVNPSALPILKGPYRYLRHPNYLAVIVEIASIPMIRGCWLTALVFSSMNVPLLWLRISAEERALGEVYQRTVKELPRIIPRLRSLSGG